MNKENKIKSPLPTPDNFSWWDAAKSVWYFLEKDKVKFSFYLVVLLVAYFCDLVPSYIMGKIIDFFSIYHKGQSLSLFYYYVLFISITYIIAALVRLKSKITLNVIGQKNRSKARIWGFERLTEFSLEWHKKENTGNKLQRIFTGAEGIGKLSKLLTKDVLRIFADIVGVALVFLFTDFKFIILIFAYIVIFLYIEFTFSKKVFRLTNKINTLNQSASGVYMEGASNMLSIKALGGEQVMAGRVSTQENISLDINVKKAYTTNLKWRLFQVLSGVTMGIFLFLIGSSVIANTMTIGMVLVFYTYFFKLLGALGDISEIHSDLIDFRSDISNMMPIFRETDFIKTGNEKFPEDWKTVEIKNAFMDYGSGQMGLKDFNLILKRNTKTGIAGVSGSGKSTLAKIILGLYALQEGVFKIGTKDYYSIKHNDTLSNITVVLQETELFNLSLQENITMMRGYDAKLLAMAIEISQLSVILDRLPKGLNSMIGEKGYMLSGGERQRLGIARAIYKNAPIIILDEATSSLDSETESKIMEKLLGEYGKDKTFLIIAHRLGTLRYTDNIAVMERGKVLEEGGYDALMDNPKSVFYRMNKKHKKNE